MTQALDSALETARLRRSLPAPPERRRLRQLAGLSQADIGEAVGVDSATISRWEAGSRSPQRHLLRRYAEVLDRLKEETR